MDAAIWIPQTLNSKPMLMTIRAANQATTTLLEAFIRNANTIQVPKVATR